jgi:hypothetical protein
LFSISIHKDFEKNVSQADFSDNIPTVSCLNPQWSDGLKNSVMESFEIIDDVTEIEIIAVGPAIREIARLRKQYGDGRWRKMKGIATVRLAGGQIRRAEIHWYEAHGIGKKEFKLKRLLD